MKKFLENGGNVNIKNTEGVTPLELAIQQRLFHPGSYEIYSQIIDMLNNAGADPPQHRPYSFAYFL